MSLKSIIKKCKRGGVTPSSEQVSSNFGGEQPLNSSPQRGEEAILSEQERTLGVQVRGEINSHTECNEESQGLCDLSLTAQDDENGDFLRHTEEQYLPSDTNISRHTEQSEVSQNREDFINFAILRGLNNCSPQNDRKNICCLMRGDVRKTTRKVAFTLAEGATHVAHWKNFRKIAFTLAEVLITIGIIGVVAALTLPTLIAKYDEMVMVNKIKRTYSELANAIEMRKAELGVSNYAEQFNPNLSEAEQLDGLVKFLNVIERCHGYSQGCGGDLCIMPKNKTNDGRGNINSCLMNMRGLERAVLNDGTVVGVSKRNWSDDCIVTFMDYEKDANGNYANVVDGKPVPVYYTAQQCAEIFFDVNGKKGRNQFGYDVYSFAVLPNKIEQHSGYGSIYDVMRTGKLTYQKYSPNGKFAE